MNRLLSGCACLLLLGVFLRGQVGDQPGNGLAPKVGDCVVYSFAVKLSPTNPALVIIDTAVLNRTGSTVRGMRVRLIKNHQLLKDWQPINLGPHAASRIHWQDPIPAQFHTNYFIVELSWGDSPANPNYVLLDTKQGQYRQAGSLIGHR
jgi:hypothetical protein